MVEHATDPVVMPPLADTAALAGFRGGPFQSAAVEAAGDSIRAYCGWHIAPVIRERRRLRVEGDLLLLPSLRVQDVHAVTTAAGAEVPGWEWEGDAVVRLPRHTRMRVVDVEFTHGWLDCPPALRPVLAERAAASAAGRVKQESIGGRSVVLEGGYDPAGNAAVDRYRLPGRP